MLLVTHENADGDALLDVKDILVAQSAKFAAVLQCVAVQVDDVYLVKRFEQRLAHATEGRIGQIRVVGDESDDAAAGLLDPALRVADELHVVVIEPFGIRLSERLAADREIAVGCIAGIVASHQGGNPLALVGRVAGIRGIAQDDHDRAFAFDCVGAAGLLFNGMHGHHAMISLLRGLKGVGQVHMQPFAVGHLHIRSAQRQRQPQMADHVRRHQQLEAEQPWQQVILDIAFPCALHPFLSNRRADQVHHLVEEGPGPGRRIEYQHSRHLRFSTWTGAGQLFGGGESQRQPEGRAQNPIHAAHDVGDDRARSEVDAAHLAHPRVVGREKSLVEVEHRLFASGDGGE